MNGRVLNKKYLIIIVYITKKMHSGPADFFSNKVCNLQLSVLQGSIDCNLEQQESRNDPGTADYN
jgi:hypothetical protein